MPAVVRSAVRRLRGLAAPPAIGAARGVGSQAAVGTLASIVLLHEARDAVKEAEENVGAEDDGYDPAYLVVRVVRVQVWCLAIIDYS